MSRTEAPATWRAEERFESARVISSIGEEGMIPVFEMPIWPAVWIRDCSVVVLMEEKWTVLVWE